MAAVFQPVQPKMPTRSAPPRNALSRSREGDGESRFFEYNCSQDACQEWRHLRFRWQIIPILATPPRKQPEKYQFLMSYGWRLSRFLSRKRAGSANAISITDPAGNSGTPVTVVQGVPVPTHTWAIWPAVRSNGVSGDILSGSVVNAPLKLDVKTPWPLPFPLPLVVMVTLPDNLVAVTV